jgi:hypothetical protein
VVLEELLGVIIFSSVYLLLSCDGNEFLCRELFEGGDLLLGVDVIDDDVDDNDDDDDLAAESFISPFGLAVTDGLVEAGAEDGGDARMDLLGEEGFNSVEEVGVVGVRVEILLLRGGGELLELCCSLILLVVVLDGEDVGDGEEDRLLETIFLGWL